MPNPPASNLSKQSFLTANNGVNLLSASDKQNAQQLLAYVKMADHENIKKIWSEKPQLMFVEVQLKNGEKMTPLKEALYNLDTYTWKPFYQAIKDNPKWVREFHNQNSTQKDHINITPLYSEIYPTYLTQARLWIDNKIDSEEHDRQWNLLATGQKVYLPKCMIKEMRRKGDFKFDADAEPKDCEPLYRFRGLSNAKLATIRGFGTKEAVIGTWHDAMELGLSLIAQDSMILQKLYLQRMSDLANFMVSVQAAENRMQR